MGYYGVEFVIACSVAGAGFGLAAGLVVHYLIVYKPLLVKYHSLRKRGFVPQFELTQRKVHDPSEGIRER